MCKLAKYVRNCVVSGKKLHNWQKFYTTAGRDGRDKFQVWIVEAKKLMGKYFKIKLCPLSPLLDTLSPLLSQYWVKWNTHPPLNILVLGWWGCRLFDDDVGVIIITYWVFGQVVDTLLFSWFFRSLFYKENQSKLYL